MSLLQIVRRSLRQHLLSTVITAFSIALASGLLMNLSLSLKRERERKVWQRCAPSLIWESY